jgi:hypothetical protein
LTIQTAKAPKNGTTKIINTQIEATTLERFRSLKR